MNLKLFVISIFTVFLFAGCNETESTINASSSSASCKGIYEIKDQNGLIRQRFNEYFVNSLGCVTDNLPLSVFEKQEIIRYEHNIQCKPQNIPSVTLLSKNNYLSTRNDSIFLDLDAQSGQFRRLIVGKSVSGVPLFQREIGCWYQRSDNVAESYGNRDYGDQILLDLELASSSLEVHPMEIFRYVKTGINWDTIRFDDPNIDWSFCNPEGLPNQYCLALRDGNAGFWPDLDTATMATLEAEAHLIRTQYNFVEINKSVFEAKWNETISTAKEFGTAEAFKNNYKFEYGISGLPDIQLYIDRAWRAFLRDEATQMPDTSSISMPLICYNGTRTILVNGIQTEIEGEVCYVNGVYQFTAN